MADGYPAESIVVSAGYHSGVKTVPLPDTGPGRHGGQTWSYTEAFNRMFRNTRFDYRRLVGNPWENSIIAIGLRWIMANAAEPAMVMNQRKIIKAEASEDLTPIDEEIEIWERTYGHPLQDLIESPNPFYGFATLIGAICLSLTLDGNAYVFVNEDIFGYPTELWWIPHFFCEPYWEGKEFISGYEVYDGFRIQDIPATRMLHFRTGIDPSNSRKGFAALKQQWLQQATDTQAAKIALGLMVNNAVGSYAVSLKSVDGKQYSAGSGTRLEEFTQKFDDGDWSGERAGKVLPLPFGAEITRLSWNLEELEMSSIWKITETRTLASMGLNSATLAMFSGAESTKFTNQLQAEGFCYRNCLIPMHKLIARGFNSLLPRYGKQVYKDRSLAWDYSGIESLQGDQEKNSKVASLAFNSRFATQNEARKMIGLPRLKKGDGFLKAAVESNQVQGQAPPKGDSQPRDAQEEKDQSGL